MTQREQARLQVLNSLLAEHMTLDQAATLMGVTTRHTRRILAAYRERGSAAVAHGHRGRRPANATPDAVVAGVVRLARTRYAGATHTHLSVNYRLEMRQKLQVRIEPPVSCSATLSVVNGQRSRQRGWLSPASSGVAPSCCSEGNNPACRFSLSR